MFKKKSILGIGITNAKEDEVLEYILLGLEKGRQKYFIVTPNPEILMLARNDTNYKKILNSAKIALPDGIGVMIAGKILNKELKERITGVDLVESLCRAVEEKPITVGFLGAGPAVAEQTAECLIARYPNLKVNFVAEEWGEEGFVRAGKYQVSSIKYKEKRKKIKILNTQYIIPNTIDILFVAFGSPKQEIWIYENLEKLPVKVVIGVGGAFDFISGKVKRAPAFIRNMGFEWLFRLISQPWRAKRQAALIKFIYLVLKERFKRSDV